MINPFSPDDWFGALADKLNEAAQQQLRDLVELLTSQQPVNFGAEWFQSTWANSIPVVGLLAAASATYAGILFIIISKRTGARRPMIIIRDAFLALIYTIIFGLAIRLGNSVVDSVNSIISGSTSEATSQGEVSLGLPPADVLESLALNINIWFNSMMIKQSTKNSELLFLLLAIFSLWFFMARNYNAFTKFIWRMVVVTMIVLFFVKPIYALFVAMAVRTTTDPSVQAVPGGAMSSVQLLLTIAVAIPPFIVLVSALAWTIVEGNVQADTEGRVTIDDMPSLDSSVSGDNVTPAMPDGTSQYLNGIRSEIESDAAGYAGASVPSSPNNVHHVNATKLEITEFAKQQAVPIAAAAATGGTSAAIVVAGEAVATQAQEPD